MNFLKKGALSLLAVAAIGLSSCDKECTPPAIGENIIGTWTTTAGSGDVEFKSNGTYVDDAGDLLSVGTSSANDTRTYEVNADSSVLTLSVVAADSSGSASVDFTIEENNCNEIKVSFFGGFSGTFTRK